MALLLAGLLRLPASAQHVHSPGTFRVTSPVLAEGGVFRQEQLYNGSGCQGKNVSPELRWTTPANVVPRSFAVTMFDQDAASGRGWWHWAIFNLPPQTRMLPAGAGDPGRSRTLGDAVRQARNDFGDVGYSGPCPPPGERPHRYAITVYALDVPELAVRQQPLKAAPVATELDRHAIAKGVLTAKFGR